MKKYHWDETQDIEEWQYCPVCKGWGVIWTGKFDGIKNIVLKCPNKKCKKGIIQCENK
jgi:hypothetical protein